MEEVPGTGTQQPSTPDLGTPDANLRVDCQEYTTREPRAQARSQRENSDITIETQGKVVGRDRKPIPAADVFKLAAIGCKDVEIAEWFGIDSNTLRYNFSVELLKGRESLKQSLRRKQIEVAMSGNAVMLIFLGKNLLGQSDSPLANTDTQPLPWIDG